MSGLRAGPPGLCESSGDRAVDSRVVSLLLCWQPRNQQSAEDIGLRMIIMPVHEEHDATVRDKSDTLR